MVNPGMGAQLFPGKAGIAIQIKKAAEAALPLTAFAAAPTVRFPG